MVCTLINLSKNEEKRYARIGLAFPSTKSWIEGMDVKQFYLDYDSFVRLHDQLYDAIMVTDGVDIEFLPGGDRCSVRSIQS